MKRHTSRRVTSGRRGKSDERMRAWQRVTRVFVRARRRRRRRHPARVFPISLARTPAMPPSSHTGPSLAPSPSPLAFARPLNDPIAQSSSSRRLRGLMTTTMTMHDSSVSSSSSSHRRRRVESIATSRLPSIDRSIERETSTRARTKTRVTLCHARILSCITLSTTRGDPT